jgi:hypothetical protein
MKKTSTLILRNFLLLFATLFTISSLPATAQTAPQPKLATPRITQAIDEANLVPMRTKVPPLARAAFDQGVVPDSQPMNRILLMLQRSPEQETALRSLMDEQQTKNSPNYHAWLTPTQFGQQFGVADADVQKVTDWLSQKGFTGIKAGPGHMIIEFSGTAGLVRNAFHTEIHSFMVNGEAHVANVSVPQMPAALAPVVTGIHALHNFRKKSLMHYSPAAARAKAADKLRPGFTATPCTPLGGGTCFAMGPADFAKIYNLPPTTGAGALNGSGQTIAIVARSNITVSDINQFGTGFGIANLTSFTAASNIILSGADPGIEPPDDGEATLDVEWSGAVAPNAKILLVVSDSQQTGQIITDGVDYSAYYIVENNLAPIMSESFGGCEAFFDPPFDDFLWEQAAAQGITVMVSTGDSGSDSCDDGNGIATLGLSVSSTASTPFNVAVGGTDFNDANNPGTYWSASNSGTGLLSAKSYIPEMTWNDSCAAAGSLTGCTSVNADGLDLVGGSGGQSNCATNNGVDCTGGYAKPTWQSAPGVPADGVRDLPDVSLFAADGAVSGNFIIICLADSGLQSGAACNLTGTPTYSFTGVGGTSASSPSFAGIMALINQSEVNAGRLKAGEGQGNVNYVLYKLATAQGTTPGTSACNSSLGTGINAGCTFNDITSGNNSVECEAGTPNCSNQTSGLGVLVEPSTPNPPFSATTPAWTTTAGYDLATGLGSVNVTNLAGNWGSITSNFIASTTTITAPAAGSVNITHGQTVNFTVTVAENSGTVTPTGDVSLIAQPTTGPQYSLTGATLSAGSTGTLPVNDLPGGTYPVVAHYAGDGTHAPSDSAPFSVTVLKENSTVQTTMLLQEPVSPFGLFTTTSVPYGSIYLFRMDVLGTLNSDNQVCETVDIPCPTGTITLTDTGGAPINDFLSTATGGSTNVATLNALGFLEDRLLGTTGITGGSHTYTASYSGDISYNASQLATPITITPASTSTAVTANGSSSLSVGTGQTVTLVATVSGFYNLTINGTNLGNFISAGAGPTGSVTFSTCGTATSCKVNVVPINFNQSIGTAASATATLTTTFSTVGQVTVSATYTTGDTNYTGSASSGTSNATVTVTATQTGSFTVGYSPQPLVLTSATGAASPLTVTVTPAGGFTGTVAVTPTAASLPPGVTCSPSPLNINVTGATAVMGTLNCQVTATSTALSASNAREDRMLEAKTIPPTTPGKGWWSLSAGTGFAALFLLFLPGGRKKYRAALGLGLVCILSLTLGCNGAGSSTTPPPGLTATVTKMTVNNDKVATGTAFTFSVAVTGGTPTGQFELFDGATMIGTAATVAAGTAAPTAPALAVGTHAISAHYLGDTTTAASASGVLNLTVTGSTTIAITTSPAATPVASPITVTVN